MTPRAEPWTKIPGQAPGNLTQKTHPLNPPLLPREGEAEGGGEFIKTRPNEHAASMRGLSVRKVVVAKKMKTKSKDKIC
jgi:hypothetical protein